MEVTSLQQRIKERATKKLLNDLRDATNKEMSISGMFGVDFYKPQLDVREHYNFSNSKEIKIYNEYSQRAFDFLLPKYISDVTDEILRKIDEIDWLVANNQDEIE